MPSSVGEELVAPHAGSVVVPSGQDNLAVVVIHAVIGVVVNCAFSEIGVHVSAILGNVFVARAVLIGWVAHPPIILIVVLIVLTVCWVKFAPVEVILVFIISAFGIIRVSVAIGEVILVLFIIVSVPLREVVTLVEVEIAINSPGVGAVILISAVIIAGVIGNLIETWV